RPMPLLKIRTTPAAHPCGARMTPRATRKTCRAIPATTPRLDADGLVDAFDDDEIGNRTLLAQVYALAIFSTVIGRQCRFIAGKFPHDSALPRRAFGQRLPTASHHEAATIGLEERADKSLIGLELFGVGHIDPYNPVALGHSPALYSIPSFCFINSLSACGLALPPEAFIA